MADEDIFDVEGLAKGLIKGLDTPKDLLVDFPRSFCTPNVASASVNGSIIYSFKYG